MSSTPFSLVHKHALLAERIQREKRTDWRNYQTHDQLENDFDKNPYNKCERGRMS